MSESWKNRLWSLLLVCTFAVVLSVCNKAMDSSSDGSSSSGTAFADGSTVTISSMPSLSHSLPTISHFMLCQRQDIDIENEFKIFFNDCDSTDSTVFQTKGISGYLRSNGIYLDDVYSEGFRPCFYSYADTYFCK